MRPGNPAPPTTVWHTRRDANKKRAPGNHLPGALPFPPCITHRHPPQISVQTVPLSRKSLQCPNSKDHPRANHSPSFKSPQITVQTTPPIPVPCPSAVTKNKKPKTKNCNNPRSANHTQTPQSQNLLRAALVKTKNWLPKTVQSQFPCLPPNILRILYPLENQTSCPEVDQQPNLQIKCLQIVQSLSKMYILQLNQSFQFHRNYLADQKIHPPRSNILSLIKNGHCPFPVKSKTLIRHFNLQRPLINYLLKAIAQSRMHPHRTTNDPPRQRPMLKLPLSHSKSPLPHKFQTTQSPILPYTSPQRKSPHPRAPKVAPKKSQPIHQIPPNHSSDNASPDTRPLPTPNSHPRANHSPSTKSPQITVQTMPVQTPDPSPPQTPVPAQITAHPPNPPKSQFRQCQSRHKSQPIHQIPPSDNHSSDNASPDTRPLPTPNSRPRANHSPSTKSPQITVQTMPVQTPAPSPPQTPVPAQITAHPPNPPKSQFRQCQSRHPPPPHPKLPSPRKSQPIHQIPPNHSSDNASPDTRPLPTPNSRPRANHSPSAKSPQITVQTMPVQTPAPPPTPNSHPHKNHTPSPKSPKSQFRQDFQLTKISNEVYNCSSELTHPCLCAPEKLRLRVWRRRSSDWRRRFHDWNIPLSEIQLISCPSACSPFCWPLPGPPPPQPRYQHQLGRRPEKQAHNLVAELTPHPGRLLARQPAVAARPHPHQHQHTHIRPRPDQAPCDPSRQTAVAARPRPRRAARQHWRHAHPGPDPCRVRAH